ncbi:4-oxalocrotonate tautomerase [Methanobacterium lacus]|jgi:4-oxalocrotonate tautomerase|uniref:4-oxalocrotonate tautomerase n=1 Tax=Methanobacterium lacus (strain AL-21) TaxID=877455 RepID=F0T9A5_METLA|nr:tautomerase family protein [Methanobacterium lacus]ADZ09856.1 4-oxalocrotonate tautomerase [Methanobacterium lacus]
MPMVQINVWKGFEEEKIEYLIKNITQAFVEVDVPAQAVEILVNEVPKSHWGVGGELCSVKFKDVGPGK